MACKNILVYAPKGGVGKSTVSDCIAFSLDRTGVPYNFVDMDAQGGTIHETQHHDDAVVTIIDAPPGIHKDTEDWLSEADLLIVPTLFSYRDIEPLTRFRDMIDMYCTGEVMYVLNRWDNYLASRDFISWFNELPGTGNRVTLPQSTVFPRAGEYSESVVTYAPKSSATRAVMEMVNMVRGLVGLPTEDVTKNKSIA